jgi:two-component system sensor histidine kinase DegS
MSDQRMPGITGIDFFESIAVEYPNPIRILLTGYSDINAVIDAVNRGKIYRYISKPWHDHDLKLTIESAYNLYALKEKNKELNSKYKKVFSDCSDPILLFNLKGKVTDFNKAALNLFDTTQHSLDMVKLHSLFPLRVDVEQIFKVLGETGIIKGYECLIFGKEEVKTCLLSANTITNSYGEVISYQAIIKDITEHARMNQMLLKKVIETQEEEREKIARELHDGVEKSLATMSHQAEKLQEKLKLNNDANGDLENIPAVLKTTISDLRRICFNTLPLVIEEQNLIVTIEELKMKLVNADLSIEFIHSDDFPEINKSLKISIFRIIQEFVQNSIKHSGANKVTIDISANTESIILNLTDNGVGFNISELELSNGKGLDSIKTRIDSFNGSVDISSIVNQGTEFDIAIPIMMN